MKGYLGMNQQAFAFEFHRANAVLQKVGGCTDSAFLLQPPAAVALVVEGCVEMKSTLWSIDGVVVVVLSAPFCNCRCAWCRNLGVYRWSVDG